MRDVVSSIEGEFRRYQQMAEKVFAQLDDHQLCACDPSGGNSVAALVWHLAGNFTSRFTDFLDSDGEKPWRAREEEFVRRKVTRQELTARWDAGFAVLFATTAGLDDTHLGRTVTIRGVGLSVLEALHRSLAHTSYHVGQMVFLGRLLKSDDWTYLSIPPGGSGAYNQNPTRERAPGGEPETR